MGEKIIKGKKKEKSKERERVEGKGRKLRGWVRGWRRDRGSGKEMKGARKEEKERRARESGGE